MAHRTKEWLSRQVQSIAQEELSSSSTSLPFQDLLSEASILAALDAAGVVFRERIFTPVVTLRAFLSQVMARENGSCCDAVSRVLSDRLAQGQKACSPDTNSYCQARSRLPEQVIAELARQKGQGLQRQALPEWLWRGREVVIIDGSTATMADTPQNQAEYPQSTSQKAGLGFPVLRFVVFLSLAVGTVLECAIGPGRGKMTGEQSLFRQISKALKPGQIVLGDRLFDAYRDIAVLRARGIDVVFGKKQSRHCDFRRGRKLGPDDHVVLWQRPKYDASRYESKTEWESLPKAMEMRETRVVVRRPGYRTRTVVVVTTLLDGDQFSSQDITDLYGQRWHCELDLRSIKRALGMHQLRCKTPEMVRKELWMHLLAYNLIRVRMAQAAAMHGISPRAVSFTAAKTLIHNLAPHLNRAREAECRSLEVQLLEAIAGCKVGDRPGRKEPRAVKKRGKKYKYLNKPRNDARKELAA